METPGRPHRGRTFQPAPRPPLSARKRLERQAARRRVKAHVKKPITASQRGVDPLIHRGRTSGAKLAKALGALLGSGAVHGAVVVLGMLAGTVGLSGRPEIRQEVSVEVRERLPPPPPPEPPPPEPPKPEVVEKPVRPPPKVAKAPPPPAEQPKGPPPRVVGLSLESTSEGGSGPAFAVGQTRLGETAERAEDPKALPTAGSEAPPTPDPAKVNRVASRIPTEGVKYSPPRRKGDAKPVYPDTLRAQGIEGDVPVMVTIDATGKVTSVKILKETPYPEMNESARQHVLASEFEPATRDGVPIPYTLSYTIRFRLEDQ
jgi:protein TonB